MSSSKGVNGEMAWGGGAKRTEVRSETAVHGGPSFCPLLWRSLAKETFLRLSADSGELQSRSMKRSRIATSIAFLFHACFQGILDTVEHENRS